MKLRRRPASSACPKGAWFGDKHHTDYGHGGWRVYETSVKQIAICWTAKEAKAMILRLEEAL